MKIRDISGESNLLALILAGIVMLLYGFRVLQNDLWGGAFLIFLSMAQLCVAEKIGRKVIKKWTQ